MLNPFSDPAYLLSPLVALIVSFILIIIVINRGQKTTGKWIFTGILFSVGVWGFLIYGMRCSPDAAHAVIWNKIAAIPATGTFVLYYHFTVAYRKAKKQRLLVLASYLFLVAIAILSPTDLIMKEMRVEDYGYAPVHGILSIAASVITFPLLAGACYNLIVAYRSSPSYEERNRILYLLIAIMFPVTGALLDAATNLPPMLVWGQVFFVLICSVSIVRFHLLDIRIVFRRGMAYLLISTIVAVPYVAVLISLNRVIDLRVETLWYHVLIILLLSIALHPFQQWAQQIVDKMFYRERYDHLMSLERLSWETQSILDIDTLCDNLMKALSGALRISTGCLFLRSNDNYGYTIKTCIQPYTPDGNAIIRKNSLLITWFEKHGLSVTMRDFDIIPHLQSLSSEEKEMFRQLDFKILFPILFQGNELTGILALGEKHGAGKYSIEDRQLITTVANQMAISVENARLYQSEKSAREAIEQMDAQKTEFLHSVAHELKTPLTAIISSSEILDEGQTNDESVRKRLYGNIRRSANIMNRRVTELLELAKTQIGETRLDISLLEMRSLILDSASQLMVLFENREQALIFDIPEELPFIEGDKDKIQQVIFNLLSNANKYSQDESIVTLRAYPEGSMLIIKVFDAANKIPEEDRENIFTPYFRVEEAKANPEAPGLGLGLAISKKFVELHHGRIWVEDNPDGGNILAFSLPVASVDTD